MPPLIRHLAGRAKLCPKQSCATRPLCVRLGSNMGGEKQADCLTDTFRSETPS